MLNIYLTRHGETEWNTENRLQGWKDSPLTESGVKNASLLGERLKNVEFQKVYTSPSKRALTTTKLICSQKDYPIEIYDELREISFGKWEGKSREEIQQDYFQEYDNFWFRPHEYDHSPHQGEGIDEFLKRIRFIMTHIIEANQEGNILIVTHGATVKAIMSYFWDIPVEKLWDPPIIYGASLSLIKWDGNEYIKEYLGDTSHMV